MSRSAVMPAERHGEPFARDTPRPSPRALIGYDRVGHGGPASPRAVRLLARGGVSSVRATHPETDHDDVSGRCLVRTSSGESLVNPGELAVLDTTQPYWFTFGEDWRMLSYKLPHTALRARLP